LRVLSYAGNPERFHEVNERFHNAESIAARRTAISHLGDAGAGAAVPRAQFRNLGGWQITRGCDRRRRITRRCWPIRRTQQPARTTPTSSICSTSAAALPASTRTDDIPFASPAAPQGCTARRIGRVFHADTNLKTRRQRLFTARRCGFAGHTGLELDRRGRRAFVSMVLNGELQALGGRLMRSHHPPDYKLSALDTTPPKPAAARRARRRARPARTWALSAQRSANSSPQSRAACRSARSSSADGRA